MNKYKSNRQVYGETLVELGKTDKRIVVIDADVSKSTATNLFSKEVPDSFFNFGAAEQNQASAAAAMAQCGLIPFVSTFAVFASMRACDQVRQSIAYPKSNVKIVACNAGIENNGDGVTHQAIEDIAILRAMPNMTIICPSDNIITKKALKAMIDYKGPVYMRLGRYECLPIHDDNVEFTMGKMIRLIDGDDISIIATGRMVYFALQAAHMLKERGINTRVIECHTIKPIDQQEIIMAAQQTKAIITCEDHNIIGGLGSAVSEVTAEKYPVKVARIGIKDTFARSARDYLQLYERYGLLAENIYNSAIELLKDKKGG